MWISRSWSLRAYATLTMYLLIILLFTPLPLFAQNQSGITSPSNDDSVSGDVIISGTAVIDPFLRYELYYKLEPSGDDAFIYFDGGTNQVVGGQLGIWRTTDLAPGLYSVRLRVVKADGNYGEFIISNLSLNRGPTPTPTSNEPTVTPIPSATFTPAPQPTPIVGQVTQPQIEGQPPVAPPTPVLSNAGAGGETTSGGEGGTTDAAAEGDSAITFEGNESAVTEVAASNSFTRQLGEAVAPDRLREYFITGMRFSALLILGITILFAGKWAVRWVWTQYR